MTDLKVKASLNYQRHSARKLQPFTRSFAGKKLLFAIDQTAVMHQDAAKMLNKLFRMVKSAAASKQLEEEKLVISQLFATQGPKIKRIRANARGRANRYVKHLAHLTAIVAEAKFDKPRAASGSVDRKVKKEGKA